MRNIDQLSKLKDSAVALQENLKQIFGNTLEFSKELSASRMEFVKGDVITVASVPRVDPSLEIIICLETTLSGDRWFWGGFYSGIAQPIRRLEKFLPSYLKYKNTSNSYESKPRNGYWYYREFEFQEIRKIKIIIEYHMEYWNGFGIYSETFGKFDLNKSAKFIRERLLSLPEFDDKQYANAATRQAIRDARIGHGEFKRRVAKFWNGKCAVLGISTDELLRASHIKPWKDCLTRLDRLNPGNGILLCAHLDALFDTSLISFSNNGEMLISSRVDHETRKLLNLDGKRLQQPLAKDSIQYLDYHRKIFDELQK